MIQKWMFPHGKSLPTVIVSHNARFDPHFHQQMGRALRPLRYQKMLLIGSGGAVHNLYRNNWKQVTIHRDNFAQERPPEQWAIDFGQAFSDCVTTNSGPALCRAMARLMQHPQYRDAVSFPFS
jgi:aromatic ring-opening dioxygenase catalytic subunit (LigB family)